MSDFLFNIENIKLLFIAASGLYSFYFLNKLRRNRSEEAVRMTKTTSMQKNYKEILNQIESNGLDTAAVYKLLSQQNEQNQQMGSKEKDEEGANSIKKQTQNSKDQQQQEKEQEQSDVSQMNQAMSKFLLDKIRKSKTITQIKKQICQKRGEKFDINQYYQSDPCDETQELQLLRIKSCKQNVVRLQDAIGFAQTSTKDESFQFFSPLKIVENQMANEDDFLDQLLKNKRFMRSNLEMIKMSKIEVHTINAHQKKHKPIVKQRLKKNNIFKKLKFRQKNEKLNRSMTTPKRQPWQQTAEYFSPNTKTEKKYNPQYTQQTHKTCNCHSPPKSSNLNRSIVILDGNLKGLDFHLTELFKQHKPLKVIRMETSYEF